MVVAIAGGSGAAVGGARTLGWVASTPRTPTLGGALSAVSCPTAGVCVAVGERFSRRSVFPLPLLESGRGTSWRIDQTASLSGQLTAVACASAGSCLAVGTAFAPAGSQTLYPLSLRLRGSRWERVATPQPNVVSAGGGRTAELDAISCWSADGCVAVGAYMAGAFDRPLAERWNGSAWTIETPPTATSYLNRLVGVSCVSASRCLAVGQSFLDARGRDSRTLAERWSDGHWSIVGAPTLPARSQPGLSAVSCVAAADCFAVGGAPGNTLIARWNGHELTKVQAPSPAQFTEAPMLHSVSCVSADSCVAVGFANAFGPSAAGADVEQWDGQSWTLSALPTPKESAAFFSLGVWCPSAAFCGVAGTYYAGRVGDSSALRAYAATGP